jgi:hypothetical protein
MNPCASDKIFSQHARRRFLAGTAALTVGCLVRTTATAQETGLRTVVTFGGQSFTYAASAGQDLGDFRSDIGRFVQGCIRVVRDDLPLIVYFRPDRDSDRIEVVYELGRLWSGTPQNLGAYRAAIFAGTRH